MQSHVADHFYVSITQLLIQIEKKWSTETWTNITADEGTVAFYCSLHQVFTVLTWIHSLSALQCENKDESLNHILGEVEKKLLALMTYGTRWKSEGTQTIL